MPAVYLSASSPNSPIHSFANNLDFNQSKISTLLFTVMSVHNLFIHFHARISSGEGTGAAPLGGL